MSDSNQVVLGKTARSPRKAVERPALAVHDEGRVIVPCTMVNASRSGLGLHIPPQVTLPNEVVIIDLVANAVFEAHVTRRDGEACGVRYHNVHSLTALPQRLKFIAAIRRPTSATA